MPNFLHTQINKDTEPLPKPSNLCCIWSLRPSECAKGTNRSQNPMIQPQYTHGIERHLGTLGSPIENQNRPQGKLVRDHSKF